MRQMCRKCKDFFLLHNPASPDNLICPHALIKLFFMQLYNVSKTLRIFCYMFCEAFDLGLVSIIGPVEQVLNTRITITVVRPLLTNV